MKTLRITPVPLSDQSLITFGVDSLQDNSTTDFDLFLKVENHIVLYGSPGYTWFRNETTELLKQGIDTLYHHANDAAKVKMYRTLARLPSIEKNQRPHQRIVSIQDVGAQFIQLLYEGEVTSATVEKAKGLSRAIVECIQEDRTCVQAISGLGDHDFYTYLHSIRVAMYSTAIASAMGLNNQTLLVEMALGGIFHDIGKKNVSLEVLNKAGALSESEWKSMKKHPELGLDTVKNSILSHVPREIILHHHEKNDGSGYPHGLRSESLIPEVQIAVIADIFDALTSSRSYQQKRTRFEALDFMRHNMLSSKISKDPFKGLVECLIETKDKVA